MRFGIKSILFCEWNTVYVMNSETDSGKTDIEVPFVTFLEATGNAVLPLIKGADCDDKSHIIVMDCYYNSVNLTHFLYKEMKTHSMGTAKKTFPKRELKELGQFDYRCNQNIVCITWTDRKPIHFNSSCHDPSKYSQVSRRNKDGSVTDIFMPDLVKQYIKFISDTDKNDQLTCLHYRWPGQLLV